MEIKKINIMAGLSEEGGRVKVKKSIAGTSWTHATGYQNSRAQNVMFFEKPVNAVLHMADEGTIFLHGTKNSSEVFVLVSRNGAKGSYEIMEYLPEEKVFTGNALSYLVTQFFIGIIRYSERNGLIDEAVDSLGTNFATTWGNMSGGKVFFDNNTTKDVADILSVVQNYISEIGEGEINSTQPIKNYKDFKVALSSLVDYDFDQDITPFLNPRLQYVADREPRPNAADWANLFGYSDKTINDKESCPEIVYPNTKNEQIRSVAEASNEDLAERDYSMISKEEIKNFPPMLQAAYEFGQKEFEDNKKFFTEDDWLRISAMKSGAVLSIAMVGPAGCGKTTKLKAYGGALGLPVVLIGGSGGISEDALFGYQTLVDSPNGNGQIMKFQDGPVTICLKHPSFLIFDEENAARPEVLMKFNSILDNSKSVMLDNGEVVRVNPMFRYAAAWNAGAGYTGTERINLSHLDRFDRLVKVSNPKIDETVNILRETTGYKNKKHLRKIAGVLDKAQRYIKDGEGDSSSATVSIRRAQAWIASAAQTGEFVKSSFDTFLSYLCHDDEELESLTVENIEASDSFVNMVYQDIVSALGNDVFDKAQYER